MEPDLSETQYEQALAECRIEQEIYQQTSGTFRAYLQTREADGNILYSDYVNQSYVSYLPPPPDSVAFVATSSPLGATTANGHRLTNDRLLICVPNNGADMVVPAQTLAESVSIPIPRLYAIAESVSPGIRSFTRADVVCGDPARLLWLRRQTRSLVQQPHSQTQNADFDNVIAEWVAWVGHPQTHSHRNHTHLREYRANIARRARSYFIDNYAKRVRMEDVCRELDVGLRALQRYFGAYFQMTPYRYLKVLRYNKARRLLVKHDPTTSSVTRIAVDSGFHHFGRFAVEYRDLFGELPRHTLEARRPQFNVAGSSRTQAGDRNFNRDIPAEV